MAGSAAPRTVRSSPRWTSSSTARRWAPFPRCWPRQSPGSLPQPARADRFAQALSQCVAGAPPATSVRLRAVPSTFEDGRVESSLLGVTLIESYTVDSMLRIAYPARDIAANIASFETLRADAQTLGFSCARLPPAGVDFVTSYAGA